jgi:hypothetical protein
MYGASAYPQIENTFYLINNTNENLEKNFKFLQAFFAGTQWLNLYAGVVQSSNVYNVICPGRFQLMWCSINAKISYAGKLRKNISMTKYSEKIKSIDIDTLWPDAWKVEITIKSLVPNNYNTHIDYYANGMNSAVSLIKNDAAFDVSFAKKYSYENVMTQLKKQFAEKKETRALYTSLSAVLTQQNQYEKALVTKANAEQRKAEVTSKKTVVGNMVVQLNNEQENFERDMAILSKNLQETTKNFSKAMQSGNDEDIKNARAAMQAAQEAYDNRLSLFNTNVSKIVNTVNTDKTLADSDKAQLNKFAHEFKSIYGSENQQYSSSRSVGPILTGPEHTRIAANKLINTYSSTILSSVDSELAEQNRIISESSATINDFENTAMNSGDTLPNEKNATVNNGT